MKKYKIQNNQIYDLKNKPVSLENGIYVIYPERSLSSNDLWKVKIRSLANDLGWESFIEFENYVKEEIFGDKVQTSFLSEEDVNQAILKLDAWAFNNFKIKL